MLRTVVDWMRRLSALAIVMALAGGNIALCAGWSSTPEARMACCTDGDACPMHKGESHHSHSAQIITQAQADTCCAASEREQSSQSSPAFVAAFSSAPVDAGVVLQAPAPVLVLRNSWRAFAPSPVAAVPKHVLLSIFLV
jgi:hypothetical protein